MGKHVPPPPPSLLRARALNEARLLIRSNGIVVEWLCQYCGSLQAWQRVSCSQCGGPKPVAELMADPLRVPGVS